MQQLRSRSLSGEMHPAEQQGEQPLSVPGAFSAQTPLPGVDVPPALPGEAPGASEQHPLAGTMVGATSEPSTDKPHTPDTSASTARPERRPIVIRAEKKRPRNAQTTTTDAPAKHLRPRARQTIVLVAVVVIFAGTLASLVPLSPGQSSVPLLSGLSILIHNPQGILQLQGQQTPTPVAQTQGHAINLNISRSQYVSIAEQDATSVGISPTYFVRQIQLESGFNPNAASPSGAVGIAQFMPSTAAGLGIDPWNPIQALQGAAKMMANLYHQYGDYAKALAAYNAGSANLNNAVSSCGSNWLSCMPAETQNYVATIMG